MDMSVGPLAETLRKTDKPIVTLYEPVLRALFELSQESNGGFVRSAVVCKVEEILGVQEEEFGNYRRETKFRSWVGSCLSRHRKRGLVKSPVPRRFSLTENGEKEARKIQYEKISSKTNPVTSFSLEKDLFLKQVSQTLEEMRGKSSGEGNFPDFLGELNSRLRGREEPWGQTETISPEKAAHLLEYNTNNRGLRRSRLDRYVKDMRSGSWKNTGQGVILSSKLPDGSRRLLNGQHTLEAILVSEKPQEILVVYDVALENFPFLDRGKERDLADILSAAGVRYSREMASMYSKFVEIQAAIGQIPDYDGHQCFRRRNSQVDSREAIKWADENYNGFRNAMKAIPNGTIAAPVSTFRALHFLFAPVDQEAADTFFKILVNGYGYSGESDPIYRLRMSLEKMRLRAQRVRGTKISMAQQVGMTIKAWNAIRSGKVYKQMFFRTNERIPFINGLKG